ncbi:cation diffusion facilitator family [Plasmopara halstedii]|uniref:Cation diffusion facilitator family n=1 Tax=Plasmopara halstedii TaxID=4781 RepID=A0A0P1AV28_PLAHL|nr:cation diffusion facilitator family [Plasmopara halstedii]CEG45586.1 cation diffusion facilitator family [Plasmopara halstedii]|eukprot:XP_024581955.1 cation diffusion facilitator family [Plasmopara halstedii]
MRSHLLLRCYLSRRYALTPLYVVNARKEKCGARCWQTIAHREVHLYRRPIAIYRTSTQPKLGLFTPTQRWHGHSHRSTDEVEGTTDEQASRLKLSAEDMKTADRITWVGIWLNVVLSGFKGAAGVAFHSSGLLADAAHSISDLVSDFVTLVSLKYCARPPDASQPYGYGKYETMGALSVSLLLVGGSLGIMVHSVDSLLAVIQPMTVISPKEVVEMVEKLDPDISKAVEALAKSPHSHAHGLVMHPAALGIAAMSVAAKEALFRTTMNIGRRVHSSVLIANAWHHRSDAITSVVALGGIGLSLAGFPLFDPLAGIAVGGIVLKMGAEMGWTATKELCDVKISENIIKKLEKAAAEVIENSNGDVLQIRQLRCRKVGRHIYVDLTLVVSDGCDVHQAVEWKQKVKSAMKNQVSRVKDVVVEIATFH